ncbi:peptidoglycan-binding domain-containing protein [Primorskyibacter sp. S187A]|uniref:peptidoglycan-binding domain-containing protein n=1 Tax=Primorskyibacter sp. S187A TaxID=3415130 RepID=UPI003C7D165F
MIKLSRSASLGILLAATATSTHALELLDGTYRAKNDGGTGLLTIRDGHASLGITGNGCVGALEGPLRSNSDGTLSFRQQMGNASCELTLQDSDSGLAWIDPGSGCSYFRGASCSFAGLVVERTVPRATDALDAAFRQMDEAARRAIQQALKDRGFYSGAIDGITGSNTRGAIIQAGEAALAGGANLRLDRVGDVRAFLMSLIEGEPVSEQPFFGTWECEGSTYVFGSDGYQNTPQREPLPYREVREFTPGIFGVTFVDGYRLGLMDVTADSMTWSSPASGDTFSCTRSANNDQAVPSATADPVPSERSARETETDEQTALPYLGRWSCTSGGMGTLTFAFTESAATVEEMGRTTTYDEVRPLGSNGTAFRFEFTDGQIAHVFEADDQGIILDAAGEVFECTAN